MKMGMYEGRTESHVAHDFRYDPRSIAGMILTGENISTARRIGRDVTLFATNLARTELGLNSDL